MKSTAAPMYTRPEPARTQQPSLDGFGPTPRDTRYLHPDFVPRRALLQRLRAQRGVPVVTICAPAGYGKSTLLAQVAKSDGRPFVFIDLEEADSDPAVLVAHIANGLDRIAGAGPGIMDRRGRAGARSWSSGLRLLGSAWASLERPAVLAFDDGDLLSGRDALDVVTALCSYVPPGAQLILTARADPGLHIARLRAERRVIELGREDLALDAAEAEALLSAAGVSLDRDYVANLTLQTEGWAAGLYLTALSMRENGVADRRPVSAPDGPDHHVTDYLRLEILSRMAPAEVDFLTRTSVLKRVCGPLCDSVLERSGSAAALESLERANRFLVPLDHQREWYRYHNLFRETLLHELELRDPDAIPILERRAAEWCEQHGEPYAAIDYAFSAGDMERAAQLVLTHAVPAYQSGRLATASRWIARLDEEGLLERHPAIAAFGVWGAGASGDPVEAERLAAIAEASSSEEPPPDGSPTIEPWVRAIRAQMCRHGIERMRADAERARELAPTWSFVQSIAALAHGMSFLIAGDDDQADLVLAEAVDVSRRLYQSGQLSFALAERSLLARGNGDCDGADRLAQEAGRIVRDADLEEYMTSAATYIALGRAAEDNRDMAGAERHFASANRLRPRVTYFLPYLAVQTRIELARTRVAAGDAGGASILLREIDQLLRRTPELGVLVEQAGELRKQINEIRDLGGETTPLLTEAELRVLPLLATHLTLAEIAQRNYVSRATIKTQAISIYRKLDVTKRSEAVACATKLGLIQAAQMPEARDFNMPG